MTRKERIQRIKDILQGKDVLPLHFRAKSAPVVRATSDVERIESLVVPNAGQSFNGNDFRELLRPGVYVAMLGDDVLYVGMSNQLLRRVGGKHKQAEKAFAECDKVQLYPCVSVLAARELETILIGRLNPKYNVRRRKAFIVKDLLGINQHSANALLRSGSL